MRALKRYVPAETVSTWSEDRNVLYWTTPQPHACSSSADIRVAGLHRTDGTRCIVFFSSLDYGPMAGQTAARASYLSGQELIIKFLLAESLRDVVKSKL